MSFDTRTLALGEIVSVKGGKRLPKGASLQSTPNSHPYIRVRDMGYRYIPAEGLEFVPDEIFPKIKRYIVEQNDVIISIVGTIGLVSIVDARSHLASQTENAAKLTGLDCVDAHYLYYYLTSHVGQQEIQKGTVGAVQPKLPLYSIEKIQVPWPEKSDRVHIVNQLAAIDDKARLNHQINQTLEQMAQAIFKSWFVDFEPVKAKIATLEAGGTEEDAVLAAMQAISGKTESELSRIQTDDPEKYAELRATAELFPSAMQDSELGEIPEGWMNGTLSEVADIPNMRISREQLTLQTYISTENMLENRKGICQASSMPSSSSVPNYEPGHVLVSNIRPYFKKIWFAETSGGRSPDVLCFATKQHKTSEFLFNLLYQDQFFDYMMLTSKGAKMPRGDKKAIMKFPCVIPPIELTRNFSDRVKSFYTIANSNKHQSESLALTRDTLLPKLLSGELSVSGAETQFAEVAEPEHV